MPRKYVLILSLFLLLFATLQPGSEATGIPYVDKIAHFILFFFLTWNVRHTFHHKSMLNVVMIFVLLLAPLTEVLQLYIPFRNFDYLDILADVLGIVLAYWLYSPKWESRYARIAR